MLDKTVLLQDICKEIKNLESVLLKKNKEDLTLLTQNMIKIQNRIYSQLESLSWLQRRLLPTTQLPPLRNWACSPDVLLRLHNHIIETKPEVVVEFGSGASTIAIADALHQNGTGKLISVEHEETYFHQTLSELQQNHLQHWVELRLGKLEVWSDKHLNSADVLPLWYPASVLADIENIDLLWIDGPPGNTCLYSRYPAMPALYEHFSDHIEIWVDDTVRQEERDICESWAAEYEFNLQYYALEKGLGILSTCSVK
tara:strand:- start:6375 stop:7142 length:768 start_codon:yes stop_codon:yes gene_type:complete